MSRRMDTLYILLILAVWNGIGDCVYDDPSYHDGNLWKYASFKCMKRDLGALKKELKAAKLRISALEKERKPIAFLVSLATTIRTLPRDKRVVFDRVLLNDGNGFDTSTGTFTAPVKGTYYFSFEGSSRNGDKHKGLHILLMKGNESMGYVFFDGNADRWLKRSTTAAMKLKEGDTVWCKVNGIHRSELNGAYLHTTFTGFKIN